jgi:hypothetical protein
MVMKVHFVVALAAWSSVAHAETRARPLAGPARTIHAMPGADLALIAASEDGRAAATVDSAGAIRVWARLDATLEPVVVTAPRPLAIAFTSDARGLSLASLDAAGTLDIVRTSPRGDERSHVRIDSARPFSQIVAWSSGFVALADDSHLELFDVDGKPTGTIAGTAGTRVRSIMSRADRVVTLVERGGEIRAITLATTMASAPLAIDPMTAVLSPDGLRVAATDPTGKHLVIVELATGTAKTVAPRTPEDVLEPIGFATNHELYVAGDREGTSLFRWDGEIQPMDLGEGDTRATRGTVAVSNRRVLVARGPAIVIHTRESTKFLGYHMSYASQIVPDGDGWIVNSGTQAVRTDARFVARRKVPIPANNELLVIDDHVALVQQRGVIHAVSLDDGTDLAEIAKGYRVQYEPSTHLIGIAGLDVAYFTHYDPVSHTTGPVVEFKLPNVSIVRLVDPATTGGRVALIGAPGRSGQPGRAFEVLSVGISTIETNEINIEQVTAKPSLSDTFRRPNRDGSLVAEIHGGRLRLRGPDGKARWAIDAHNATDMIWNRAGELMLVAGGAARVDLATGELRERQCGWLLELSDNQSLPRGDALCDVP